MPAAQPKLEKQEAPECGTALRVLLIDTQPLFIEALAAAIRRVWPQARLTFARTCTEGLEQLRVQPVEVVIADVEALRGSLECVVAAAAPAPLIATASAVENAVVVRTLACGARGYLPKTMSGEAVCGAITLALDGGACLPPQTVAAVVGREPRVAVRSGRESEILTHLARGASNKAIARELGLSVATVKLHVQSILRSTGARNRVEAIINARKMGMLT